jgi:hypothetical protein
MELPVADPLEAIVREEQKYAVTQRTLREKRNQEDKKKGEENVKRAQDPAVQARIAELLHRVRAVLAEALVSPSFSAVVEAPWPRLMTTDTGVSVLELGSLIAEVSFDTRPTLIYIGLTAEGPTPSLSLFAVFPGSFEWKDRTTDLPTIPVELEARLLELADKVTLVRRIVRKLEGNI